MRKSVVPILLLVVLMGSASAYTFTFVLDQGDPHWVMEIDPNGVLRELDGMWESDRKSYYDACPEIVFKVPEVYATGGSITFRWCHVMGAGAGAPSSYDGMYMYASKDMEKWIQLLKMRIHAEAVCRLKNVTVDVPPGYTYFKIRICDYKGGLVAVRLDKTVTVETPVTETPTELSYTMISLALAAAAALALILYIRRR